jgi:hypothetical protein
MKAAAVSPESVYAYRCGRPDVLIASHTRPQNLFLVQQSRVLSIWYIAPPSEHLKTAGEKQHFGPGSSKVEIASKKMGGVYSEEPKHLLNHGCPSCMSKI